ncbi:MAG: ferredoxin [Solirubrobacteraceae bacterium]
MGLKVRVDPEACQGYACCLITAPTVFDMNDETGKAIVLRPEPDESLRDLVEKAARGCPAHAITVETT